MIAIAILKYKNEILKITNNFKVPSTNYKLQKKQFLDNRMQYFREIGGQAYNLPADNTAALIVIIPHVLLCLSLLLAAFRWLRK